MFDEKIFKLFMIKFHGEFLEIMCDYNYSMERIWTIFTEKESNEDEYIEFKRKHQ